MRRRIEKDFPIKACAGILAWPLFAGNGERMRWPCGGVGAGGDMLLFTAGVWQNFCNLAGERDVSAIIQ